MSDEEVIFAALDHHRLQRHQQLLHAWQDLDAEELAADLVVLAQLLAYRQRQELLVAAARLDTAHGATHDCGEWWKRGVCQLCGAAEPR